jgi:hypothetical protein
MTRPASIPGRLVNERTAVPFRKLSLSRRPWEGHPVKQFNQLIQPECRPL